MWRQSKWKAASLVTGTPHTHAYRVAAGIVRPEVALFCVLFICTCCTLVTVLPRQQPRRPEGHAGYSDVLYVHVPYIVLWWVLSRWLSHQARAVKAPVRFPLPAWPCCRREGEEKKKKPAAVNGPLPRPASRARCRSGLPQGAVVCFFLECGGAGVSSQKRRGAPTAAGSAGVVAGCCRGRWCFLTTGGIKPPLLWYESILLTSGPLQASCTIYRVCSTNIHIRSETTHTVWTCSRFRTQRSMQAMSTPAACHPLQSQLPRCIPAAVLPPLPICVNAEPPAYMLCHSLPSSR